MQLPLLIREKIDYYRYIGIHKERIKQLNQEYKVVVCMETYRNKNYICLYWDHSMRTIMFLKGLSRQYSYIRNFRDYKSIFSCSLPNYYYYSSGLNNPNGYK